VPFPIIDISNNTVVSDEQLGSKSKFWIARDAERWLFKEARENTGEDWAEKVASEVAQLIDVSAARTELAEYAGRRGCLSLSFVGDDESLVHGNEILAGQIVGYERQKRLRQSDHTFDNIVAAVQKLVDNAPWYPEVLRDLAHYLVFDALICNTDRHHELPRRLTMPPRLAASSATIAVRRYFWAAAWTTTCAAAGAEFIGARPTPMVLTLSNSSKFSLVSSRTIFVQRLILSPKPRSLISALSSKKFLSRGCLPQARNLRRHCLHIPTEFLQD
jgi:hypothetical protein